MNLQFSTKSHLAYSISAVALVTGGLMAKNVHIIAAAGHLTVLYALIGLPREERIRGLPGWKKIFAWIAIGVILVSVEALWLLLEFSPSVAQ